MSIKSISCPKCRTGINVPASMTSTKCPSCGTVFDVASGAAATSGAASSKTDKRPRKARDTESPSGEKMVQWAIVGGVATLALLGILAFSFFPLGRGDGEQDPDAEPAPPMREQAAVVEALELDDEGTPEFKVVNLPESTRQSIYRDYKKMIGSSFGKAKKIPSGGISGQSLNQVLGKTVDREVTRMALIHGISEEDIAQIYAEGEAKGW